MADPPIREDGVDARMMPVSIKQVLMQRIKGNDADSAAIDVMIERGTTTGELCDFFNLTPADRRAMGFPFFVDKPRSFGRISNNG